jgi:hypothetical protein
MRNALLNCCYLDWSKISPAIFGSMFQSVMNPLERRNLGAHYTSEKNILKLIKPLFLDELWAEFEKVKGNENNLKKLHHKISKLRFLDPACGCGNFLIIAYKELRLLEIEIVKLLLKGQTVTNISEYLLLDVDKFYGIEYEEFPARIAEVAMWLIDHQMNMLASETFGEYYIRLPLGKSATIMHGNALQVDWQSLLNKENSIDIYADHVNVFVVEEPVIPYGNINVYANTAAINPSAKPTYLNDVKFDYIMGNPPFIGSKIMKQEQRDDIVNQFRNVDGSGILDYVTGWYCKAAKYIRNTNVQVGFVSTNSVVQGEQPSILWGYLMNVLGVKINFAHRTFKWSNEAKGNAAVYCVIIGFANFELPIKRLFEYEDIRGEAHESEVKNINGYLVDGKNIFLNKKSKPFCNVPKMNFGNIALDSGHLIFTNEEKNDFIKLEPNSEKWFKKLLGAIELLYSQTRWCLWLVDIQPNELRLMPKVLEQIKKVKEARANAKDKGTQKLADRAHQFRDLNNPDNYIAIPITTGENRKYIPIIYADKSLIPAVTVQAIPNGNLFHFGILTSTMHMAWVKTTCGRLKSDFRYSKDIVYNNYSWPENPTDKQKQSIETCAQKVLDTRAKYPNSSLADLYDPLTMPADLVMAHNELDKAVDLAYRPQAFTTEAKRMEFLFELYEKYTAGLFAVEKKGKKNK